MPSGSRATRTSRTPLCAAPETQHLVRVQTALVELFVVGARSVVIEWTAALPHSKVIARRRIVAGRSSADARRTALERPRVIRRRPPATHRGDGATSSRPGAIHQSSPRTMCASPCLSRLVPDPALGSVRAGWYVRTLPSTRFRPFGVPSAPPMPMSHLLSLSVQVPPTRRHLRHTRPPPVRQSPTAGVVDHRGRRPVRACSS